MIRVILLFLALAAARFSFGCFHLSGGGNAPLLDLNADSVLTGLESDGVFSYLNDLTGHAADSGDLVAKAQGVAHILNLFLFLVFRTDKEEIENGKHEHEHKDGGAACACSGGSSGKDKIHFGFTSEKSIFVLYMLVRQNSRYLDAFIENFRKFVSEAVEIPGVEAVAYALHKAVVEIEVMRHGKAHRKHLLSLEKMAYIRP